MEEESLDPCHSEASNISATSEETPTKNNKMKEKQERDEEYGAKHEIKTRSRVLLDLKLTNDELVSKGNPSSKLELNLLNSPNASESNEGGGNPQTSESKTFTCNFCRREFSTSQALGGHQNAHKQERALAKHRHNMVDMTAAAGAPPPYGHPGYSYYPYSPFPHHHQLPFYGGLNRSLGVRTESMIHKPNSYHNPWPTSSFRFAREKMPRAYLINPNPNPNSSSTTPYLENFQSRALGMDKFGGSLSLGGNPNPNPNSNSNPTINENNACNASLINPNEDDDHHRNHQGLRLGNVDDLNDQDASGIDLNLKL